MKYKIGKFALMAGLATMLAGCTRETENIVNISIFNSKPEIHSSLVEASKIFGEENPDIKVKVLNYNKYNEVKYQLASKKANENTPTIMIVDSLHIQNMKDEFVSLENESWMEYLDTEIGEAGRNSAGDLIAFPFAVEGMGFIYNKSVLEECNINPDKIRTQAQLEAAFKKVEASGRKGVIITNDSWSLANHFFTTAYSVKSSDGEEKVRFIENLKAGTVDVQQDKTFNGLLDTFDLMKTYNMYKAAPLSNTNERSAEALGRGEVGFWYMGNWAIQDVLRSDVNKGEYGFIPVPISNDSEDFGNNEITAAIKYLVIDKVYNSEEQQEAAKRFVDWLVYSEEGNKFMIEDAELIPGVTANDYEYKNSLSNSIKAYQDNNQVVEQMMAYLPDTTIEDVGALLRAYLNNEIDRPTFLTGIKEFWIKNK